MTGTGPVIEGPADEAALDDAILRFRHWAIDQALPLWSGRGFDADAGLFEEQLLFDRTPNRAVPRRVMVQARQVSVFALVTHLGWFDGRARATIAATRMIELFWAADGDDGWVFSLARDGTVANPTRDLYAHAFVLFALAWIIRLAPEPRFFKAAAGTVEFLDRRFADLRHGGFWDALPRPDALRRQNPHMHLLEAFIALFEATGDPAHLAAATRLVDLARQAFIDEGAGTLREHFHDDWRVAPAPGLGSVEPGHQFEWAWLLRRYETFSGHDLDGVIRSLVRSALARGTDRASGRIVDEVGEDGHVRASSSRSWPHAEALKSLAVETARGRGEYRPEMRAILIRLHGLYCPPHLAGGWCDHLSETDTPLSRAMPASTLYHLMFAQAELAHYQAERREWRTAVRAGVT